MEVANEATLAEIDTETDSPDDLLIQPADLETADASESDVLTDSSTPLIGDEDLLTQPADLETSDPTDAARTLEVTGRGVVAVDTDIAQIQAGIEIEGATASEVQQQIAQNLSAVVEQLNELEVDDLQTISVSLRPKLEFDDLGGSTVVGFTGRNVLQFEVPTDSAGETIDAAIQAGANTIDNINFVATPEELNKARLEAIKLAAQDARSSAAPLFEALDLKPLEIVDIDILGVNSPSPRSLSPQFEAEAFDAATPIIGGSQDVVAEVALDINYTDL